MTARETSTRSAAAAETNEKCAVFLETLNKLRSRSTDAPVDELLTFIYNELDLTIKCAAMQDAPHEDWQTCA